MSDDYDSSETQLADIYAKLETAEMFMKLGTELAKQVDTDIKFYKITNPLHRDIGDL